MSCARVTLRVETTKDNHDNDTQAESLQRSIECAQILAGFDRLRLTAILVRRGVTVGPGWLKRVPGLVQLRYNQLRDRSVGCSTWTQVSRLVLRPTDFVPGNR
jgi:phage FluMu protein gp41